MDELWDNIELVNTRNYFLPRKFATSCPKAFFKPRRRCL